MPADQFGAKPYSNPTPTVPPQRVALAAASSAPEALLRMLKRVSRHRSAALEVQQRRIPCITDLAGKKADAIRSAASRTGRIDDADTLVSEIRPIALGFQTEDPLAGLPAVTELAADDASRPMVQHVGSDGTPAPSRMIHAITALAPAAIAADVEAGPVIDGSNDGRRRLVSPRRKIGRHRRPGQGNKTNCTE